MTEQPSDHPFVRSRDCDLAEALQYYPFACDETNVSPLNDHIVVARKAHPRCWICEGPIAAGERHRALTERNNEERKIMTWRFCNKCCRAMAHPDTWDQGRLIESRHNIGHVRRGGRFVRLGDA